MNAHDLVSMGFTGEFESEVALPVRVRYALDSEGRVEVTQVCLMGGADGAAFFLWPHLSLRERELLEHEAEKEARQAQE